METTENNKLIAEFMGLKTTLTHKGIKEYYKIEYNSGTWYEHNDLQYHSSWGWLMPVVREILTLIDINQSDYDASALKFEVLDDDINQAYKEVIEFIKEYN